ncbi:MAG: hypothetical protein LBG59_01425 [Candidatus Peribacteria bacterium]|nr:hypothetical protein [Candidatus Peribacteria bacterium]
MVSTYLQDFMDKQELMCVSAIFMLLDGGGSNQLFAKNANGNDFHLSGDNRGVINAFVVKDN